MNLMNKVTLKLYNNTYFEINKKQNNNYYETG